MTSRLQELRAAGVSIWLDTLRRGLLISGQLQRMIAEDGVTGVTSNPTIFEKAIAGATDYDVAIAELLERGVEDRRELFFALALGDVRGAADALSAVYDASDRADGFASFEVTPDLAHDTEGTIAQAKKFWERLERRNVMIKVPGTPEGIPAIEDLTAGGINVNVTLLFAVERYEQAALAYIAGLERRLGAGQSVAGIASVASFFVSRVDTAVDRLLPPDSMLRGKAAIANARRAYARFRQIFSGERWERLARHGARVQRPLWASTGTKDPAYSDVLYVEELIASDTVNTMPEHTLLAFKDHGRVRRSIDEAMADAARILREVEAAGVDFDAVTERLLAEGIDAFADSYAKLVRVIDGKVDAMRHGRLRRAANLAGLEQPVSVWLQELGRADGVRRIWAKDHTVWRDDPTEIADRLGWLTVHEVMQERVPELQDFARACAAQGLRTCVLAGMGGSSLAPEVLRATFGVAPGMLDLVVLDTTHPDQIAAVERSLDLRETLFVIASKSGTTTETNAHLEYFWDKLGKGEHFVAITDPGTPLESLARERAFRHTFLNPEDIGGRYSALSYFGLVPGALIGADLDGILDRAVEMANACAACVPCEDNPGAWLGAAIGESALAGRDKLTFVLDERISSLGYWLEQLLAESTGKEGRGIVPVEGEDLGHADVYGADRMFVGMGAEPILAQLEPLEAAGHPVAMLAFRDRVEAGGEFFRWEFATAIAGAILGINPFDQPNVQEAKDATKRVLEEGGPRDIDAGSLADTLAHIAPGDYLAIQAYLPRNEEAERRLHAARMRLRDRLRVATTLGFGPRFLHSTGQLHKGGPDSGVFVQVVEPPAEDLPIPGKPYSFGRLLAAQAAGDLQSLRAHGRRAVRVRLDELERVSR